MKRLTQSVIFPTTVPARWALPWQRPVMQLVRKSLLIAGPVSLDTPNGVRRINVQSAMQMLEHSMEQLDKGCDIFIATAAVADYRVAEVAEHKIKKAGDELNVALIKNPDIVATIAQQQKRPFMVGFAAETRNVEEYAAGKLVAKNWI